MEESEQKSFFHILSFSMFSDVKGPVPVYCYPRSLAESTQVEIAMKSVSLLMGEAVYQAGLSDDLRYFGILPFPDLNYTGLTYFFLIPDEKARGKSKAATVTFVVKESDHHFIYDNIHSLRILLDKARIKLRIQHEITEIQNILDALRIEILAIYRSSSGDPSMHSHRLKIVFTGLDDSGKTSFLKTIKKEYSELMDIIPTRGIARTERELKSLGITALEWDFGGQVNYCDAYFSNASLYLNDVDLLFYFIDIQNLERIEESLSYFSRILDTLENFKNNPIIQVVFHKDDPDLIKNEQLTTRISSIQDSIQKLHSKWDLRIYNTSIFDSTSMSNCFSYGLSRLSPNKHFVPHIKQFVKNVGGHVGVLLTKNALILGQYSVDSQWLEFVDDLRLDIHELFKNSEALPEISEPYQILGINGLRLVYYSFSIDSYDFFIFFDSSSSERKIKKKVSKLKKQITPIIQSYWE